MNEIELLTAYRQELHKIQIKNGFTDEQMASYRRGFVDAIGAYERRIAADVQPVKHGKWIIDFYYWCSECEKAEPKISDYCPNCGAKMNGDKND